MGLICVYQFSETFAPVVTDMSDQAIKLLIDGFASAYGLLSAFSWNKLLKDAPYFKQHSNDHGWAKGEVFGVLNW